LGNFNIFSAEKLVLDDEVAGSLRAALRPISTEEDDLALEVIERAATGGGFLMEEHTVLHCRDYERPTFFNRANLDAWQRRGGVDAREAAGARVSELLESYQPPEMEAAVRRQLEAYCLG
jgi:trimethylamine--corrinoid protein Co-methyltransferase